MNELTRANIESVYCRKEGCIRMENTIHDNLLPEEVLVAYGSQNTQAVLKRL